MKQLYICLLLLLAISTSALAQKDFRKGYIVQGTDTLRGYVDYRGDMRSSQTTTFKSTLAGNEQVLTPDAIAGYGFENESKAFESKRVTPSEQTSAATQNLFMNVLVKGPVSIYAYRDSNTLDHYYLQKDTLLTELLQREREILDPKTGKIYMATSKIYKGVLKLVFTDCPAITMAQLDRVKLLHRDLIDIATKYNQCVAPVANTVDYRHRQKKAVITLGPVLVYTQGELQFMGTYQNLDIVELKNETHVGGGLSVNGVLPYISEKISVQADLLYIPSRFTGTRGSNNSTYYTFDLAYIKLPVQLRYTYPKGIIRPFVNAGYLIAYTVKDKNEKYTSYSAVSTTPTKTQILADDTYRKGMDGFTGGLGVSVPFLNSVLSLEGRYERDRRFSNRIGQGSRIEQLNILLSYGF